MEANNHTLFETDDYARDEETTIHDRKRAAGLMTAVQQDTEEFEDAPEGLDEDKLEAINDIRRQQCR